MRWLVFLSVILSLNLYSQNNISYLSTPEFVVIKSESRTSSFEKSSFELSGGMIVVNASVNGETGKFIFDTGAPALVINSKKITGTTLEAGGISGSFSIGQSEVESFEWGSLVLEDVPCLIADISHLDKVAGHNLKGLIGFDIVEDKVVVVELDKQSIDLLTPREARKLLKGNASAISIPFALEGHIPVVEVKLNGKVLRMGLDTGAESNLIDISEFANAVSNEAVHKELLRGLDGRLQEVPVVRIEEVKASGITLKNSKFIFTDLSHLKNGTYNYDIDGLLGLSFLGGNKFAIDYRKHRIHIW